MQASAQLTRAAALQVVTGLTTLQNSIGDLLRAYMTHCNTIVGGGSSNSLDISNFLNNVSGEPLALLETKQRRRRAKKEKDPNAPKRPLTAYFLYSHHARDIIKNDLKAAANGVEPKSQEVQDEATRRWNNMAVEEKKVNFFFFFRVATPLAQQTLIESLS